MKTLKRFAAVLILAGLGGAGAGDGPKTDPPLAKKKADYTEFSKLIQKLAAGKIPKVFEDTSGWGQTIPIPPDLRLPRLRVTVKVGNRLELPHGLWRKVKVTMKDPAKDLRILVKDFKQVNPKTFRLSLDIDAAFNTAVQAQLWQKGLALPGFAGHADATVNLPLDCDVAVSFVAAKFPPELKIEPKVANLKMNLKDFTLKQVSTLRLGKLLEGEQAKEVGNQYKKMLQDLMHQSEPQVKDYANQAIAKALQEGKGTISASSIYKILSAAPKEKKVSK